MQLAEPTSRLNSKAFSTYTVLVTLGTNEKTIKAVRKAIKDWLWDLHFRKWAIL